MNDDFAFSLLRVIYREHEHLNDKNNNNDSKEMDGGCCSEIKYML